MFPSLIFPSRLVACAGVVSVALGLAAGARASVSAPPIIGSFAFHSTNSSDGTCSDVYGLQFKPVRRAIAYADDYYDGYYKSDFGNTETSAEFLAETYSTKTLYFHGITGGTGPQPCTSAGNNDGGRFPDPPLITPEYPTGENPPLASAKSSAKPATAGHAVLQAASGAFPVGAQASVDITLTSNHPLTAFRVSNMHVSGGAKVIEEPELESLAIPAHMPQAFSATVEGKHAGRVALKVTFTGSYKPTKNAKKATKVTITATSSLVFAKE